MTGMCDLALEHVLPHRLQLEQKLFEPEFVDLMDDDEQELVVRGWIA